MMACKHNEAVWATVGNSLTHHHRRYRVVGYGVKLSQNKLDQDVWTFSFTLQRECAQTSIKEALSHPTADELDDYLDYHRAKAAGDIPRITEPLYNHGNNESLLTVRGGVPRHMSTDSGYQSMRGFKLDRAQGSKGSEGNGNGQGNVEEGKGKMKEGDKSEKTSK